MTTDGFCKKWRSATNYLGLPAVGIHVNWKQITEDSLVKQLFGKEAWEQLYEFSPPWFKKPKTFRGLIDSKDSDCLQIIKEEADNGKLEYYRKNGLTDTSFCAFADSNSAFVLLGDGNHRFLDCAYLIDEEKRSFAQEIEKTSVDIIYFNNFDQVMEPTKTWPTWKREILSLKNE